MPEGKKPESRFVLGEPAMLIGKTLVVADLHNGIEYEMWKKGANVPSSTPEKLERMARLIVSTKPKQLVILGDFKHNVPITSRQEENEVPKFLSKLQTLVPEIIITKGNHDGNIESLVPSGIEVMDEFIKGKTGFLHGHKLPSDDILSCELISCGHTHPAVLLREVKGGLQKAWIEADLITKNEKHSPKAICVPAFDESLRGTPVNTAGFLGPFMKKSIIEGSSEAYLLDGSYLGKIHEI